MLFNLIITGVGGQGNVLASQIVGRTAVKKGMRVTIGETFGLSQRGGPVMSHIRLSDHGQTGPLIPPCGAHIILGLEPMETLRIVPSYGNQHTIYIVNSRPIYPLNVIAGEVVYPDLQTIQNVLTTISGRLYWIEATKHALQLGPAILMNMIMLGALCAIDSFPLNRKDFDAVLPDIFPATKCKLNHEALAIGERLIQSDRISFD
ncbi:MAG: indolepyruvate oxidoreductase subunit beta [Desulfobacterales bacterium]|nr:indolepyruvate oxidoreductase subunit beta [Desulfobacterales bacterium]